MKGFNPRARAGRDPAPIQTPPVISVSIHAPARGATLDGDGYRGTKDVSIHAPARGATIWYGHISYDELVSIHAPARGATFWAC